MQSTLQSSLRFLAVGICLTLYADALMPKGAQVLKLDMADDMAVESQHSGKAVTIAQSQGTKIALTQATLQARSATVALKMCKEKFRHIQTQVQLQSHAASVALRECKREIDSNSNKVAQSRSRDDVRLGEAELQVASKESAQVLKLAKDMTTQATHLKLNNDMAVETQHDKPGTLEPVPKKSAHEQMALTQAQLQLRSASIALTRCKAKVSRTKTTQALSARAAQVAIEDCNRKNSELKIEQNTAVPISAI